ncbi:MAG: hypothetical protein RL128_2162, partial [Pseudomonadota bacterium]
GFRNLVSGCNLCPLARFDVLR